MKENKPRHHSLCHTVHIHGECPVLDKEKLTIITLPDTSPECEMLSARMWKWCSHPNHCDNPMHESNKGKKVTYKKGDLLGV